MTHQEATIKAVKLLRLAQSPNEHEAALAMSRAQAIIEQHKLSNLSLDMDTENPAEDIVDFSHDPLEADYASWKYRLAIGICRNNQSTLYKSFKKLVIVGRPSDANAVRYLYGWMVREVDNIAAKNCKGCGRTFWNNFRLGVVETVVRRLGEMRTAVHTQAKTEAATSTDSLALVRVNTAIAKMDARMAEVNQWTKKNLRLRTVSSSTRSDPTARELGRAEGAKVRIQPPAGSLGSRTLQLS